MNDMKVEHETQSMLSALKRKENLKQKEKRFAISKKLDKSDRLKEEKERWDRFVRNREEQDRLRNQQRKNLNDQFRSIEYKRLEHNKSLDQKKEYVRELNDIRRQDNEANRQQQKIILDSIKERIWRKHKRFQAKRARQMQITAPPSTFDIYMQSSQVWNPNRAISPNTS